jgi:hypothetical protein
VVLAVLVLPARLHGVAVRGRRRRIGLARRADSAAGRLLERVNTFESTLDCSKLHVSHFFSSFDCKDYFSVSFVKGWMTESLLIKLLPLKSAQYGCS